MTGEGMTGATVEAPRSTSAAPRARRELPALELLALALVAAGVLRPYLSGLFDDPAVQTWATIFVSITIQALPFLVLGVVISGLIAAFVSPEWFARVLPRRVGLSVPAAGLAGVVLPGCECGSVPIAGRLVSRGVPPAAAFAFLLSAPAINPVVMVATAVAFPGRPEVVAARFIASLVTAVVVGWLWVAFGREPWITRRATAAREGAGRWEVFRTSAQHDFLHAGGFLVVGGITAATLNVVIPESVLDSLAGSGVVAVLTLSLLAVMLAICSEADAFVAASLTNFSLTSRLAFMTVGPMVDVKLIALQAGTFGRSFALRFAPATFVVAVLTSVAVGSWLL
ncbi:MAG TPA: permease [Mycobacteriales bacterium]|nr:permease [Mycobacteriales bacterium]